MINVQHPDVVQYKIFNNNIIDFSLVFHLENIEKFYVAIKLIIQFNNV